MGMADEAAFIKAPVSGAVIRVTVSSTAARFAIPAAFVGMQCFLRFDVAGTAEPPTAAPAECDILFGDSSVTCTFSQESSVASEAITVHAQTGLSLRAGELVPMVMPPSHVATHFSVDTDGTGGELVIWRG